MDANNLSSEKDSLEVIFADVSSKLEDVITHYRNLFISNQNDIMRKRIGAFCEELVDLRKKINDKEQPLAIRSENVENISRFMGDLLQDVTAYKIEHESSSLTNEVIRGIDFFESLIGMGSKDTNVIEGDVLNDAENTDGHYFQQKAMEIKTILANHPELK